jgi:hypothetical protein
VVRNASNNSDTADCDKAIGELLLDKYLAVHIENLAGGPLYSGRRAVTPKPHHSRGRCRPNKRRCRRLKVCTQVKTHRDEPYMLMTPASIAPKKARACLPYVRSQVMIAKRVTAAR